MAQTPAQEVGVGAVDGVKGATYDTVVEFAFLLALVGLLVLFLQEEGTLLEDA